MKQPMQRVLIPIPYPVSCPKCGSHATRMNGVHYNARTETRLEFRFCHKCGARFTGARGMTVEERQQRGLV